MQNLPGDSFPKKLKVLFTLCHANGTYATLYHYHIVYGCFSTLVSTNIFHNINCVKNVSLEFKMIYLTEIV